MTLNNENGVIEGGDVNVKDSDGDTPLYTVESLSTAQWLVQHGATVDMKNNEDLSVSRLGESCGTVS